MSKIDFKWPETDLIEPAPERRVHDVTIKKWDIERAMSKLARAELTYLAQEGYLPRARLAEIHDLRFTSSGRRVSDCSLRTSYVTYAQKFIREEYATNGLRPEFFILVLREAAKIAAERAAVLRRSGRADNLKGVA